MSDLVHREEDDRSGSLSTQRGGTGWGGIWDYEPFRSLWQSGWSIAGLEVTRREDGYDIELPVPGFRAEDIEITYRDGMVTVSGRNTRRSMRRSFTLPEDIDEERIAADMDNGILTLHLKQHPKQQPRKIAIGSGARTGTTVGTTQSTASTAESVQSTEPSKTGA